MSKYSELKDKFLHGGGLVSTFLRSSVSSQVASWIDLGTSMLLYSFVFVALDPFYRSNLSVAIGAIAGGIVNCCINYKFTFRAEHCSVKAVAIKYLLIWGGSFVLNLAGTTGLTHLLQHIPQLASIGIKPDGIFAFSRLSVSLAVSLAWNFLLQKNFVYVPTRFDSMAIRIVDALTLHNRRHQGDTK